MASAETVVAWIVIVVLIFLFVLLCCCLFGCWTPAVRLVRRVTRATCGSCCVGTATTTRVVGKVEKKANDIKKAQHIEGDNN